MELSYILNAVKRYWWAIVACVVLATAVGFTRAKPAVFVSRATVSVDPTGPGTSGGSESPDRFVATEVSEMNSQGFAADVAFRLGKGTSVRDLQSAVTVTNRTGTDLVDIVAKTPDPTRAEATVHAYVVVYLRRVQQAAANERLSVSRQFDGKLDAVGTQLSSVNAQIAAVPNAETARPDLMTQRQTLLAEYAQLTSDKSQAQLAASSPGTTQVIEPGTDPIMSAQGKIRAYGPWIFLGLLAGIFCAVALARLSRRVLDAEEVAEIMGRPVVGELPKDLASSVRGGLWWAASPETTSFLDELCTRIESCERSGTSLTVLVAGSEQVANSGALAHAVAARLGRWGLAVAFGNADSNAAGLFSRSGSPALTIPEVIAGAGSAPADRARPAPRRLTYVDMTDAADVAALHRMGPTSVLSVLSEEHDIVLIGTGPLLEARVAAKLAPLVDVVVLVVPVKHQTRRRLQAVAQQLAGGRGELLIVDDAEAVGEPPEDRTVTRAGPGKGGSALHFKRSIPGPTTRIGESG